MTTGKVQSLLGGYLAALVITLSIWEIGTLTVTQHFSALIEEAALVKLVLAVTAAVLGCAVHYWLTGDAHAVIAASALQLATAHEARLTALETAITPPGEATISPGTGGKVGEQIVIPQPPPSPPVPPEPAPQPHTAAVAV